MSIILRSRIGQYNRLCLAFSNTVIKNNVKIRNISCKILLIAIWLITTHHSLCCLSSKLTLVYPFTVINAFDLEIIFLVYICDKVIHNISLPM